MIKLARNALGLFAVLFAAVSAVGQDSSETLAKQVVPPLGETNRNRIGLSYRLGFNISAEFRHLGGFTALNPLNPALPKHPLRTPNGDVFNYDNGYIYPDNTTANAHPGYTWYYGYAAGTPTRPGDAPTDFDLYHTSSPANLTSPDNDGDPQHGMEVTYNRQFGRAGRGFWGLEAAVGFTDISIEDSRRLLGTAVRAADTFRTGGGAVLKPAPFEGTATGPGPNDPTGWPLVSLSSVGNTTDSFEEMATVTGHRQFDAQVVGMRVGPYLDIPLSKRWMFTLSGGLALLEVNSDFSFDERVRIDSSVTLVSLPAERHHASGSSSDLLVGGYFGGSFSYAFNDRFRLFAGAQLQSTGDYSQTVAGKTVVLDLSQSVFATLGATFSF
jgi:hypothetical protein